MDIPSPSVALALIQLDLRDISTYADLSGHFSSSSFFFLVMKGSVGEDLRRKL
jgi:hypothetical protein